MHRLFVAVLLRCCCRGHHGGWRSGTIAGGASRIGTKRRHTHADQPAPRVNVVVKAIEGRWRIDGFTGVGGD